MKKAAITLFDVWENWQKKKKIAIQKISSFQDQEILSISLDGEFIRMPNYSIKIKMYNNEIEIF